MMTRDNVKYVADLARIALTEEELTQHTKELEAILQYITQLEKLDVSQVEPTSHVLSLENVYRSDTVRPSLTQEQALSTAVSQLNGVFKVPQVIE